MDLADCCRISGAIAISRTIPMWPYDSIVEFGSLLDKVCQIKEHGYIVHG
jgi:hypothetical protein